MIKSVNVCAVGKIQSGISNAGNEWRKQEFVVEWFENPTDTQSQKVVLSVMNDRIEQLNIKYGDKLEVRFDLKYREYNGRYFMDVFAPILVLFEFLFIFVSVFHFKKSVYGFCFK